MNPLGAAVRRARRLDPLAADLLLALLLIAVSLIGLAFTPDVTVRRLNLRQPDAVAVILVLGQTLPIAFRRRRPGLVFVTCWAFTAPYLVLGYPSNAGVFGVLVATYTVAAHGTPRGSATAGIFTAVWVLTFMVGGALFADREITVADVVSTEVIFATAWVLGDSVRSRRARTAALEDRAARLESEREEQARSAASEERARIARELHDVVAHNVSVMVVQAGAARRVIETDPGEARQSLAAIERTGRDALEEMRRLLGVLRADDEATEARLPQPAIASLDRLVEQVREAGLPVDVSVEGRPRPLPESIDLSAYRIVQEALTNTLKHAGPARAWVRLRYEAEALQIEVTDDGRGAAANLGNGSEEGHGLLGMRQRVALFGGELRAGPRRGGGYTVSARLPADPRR